MPAVGGRGNKTDARQHELSRCLTLSRALTYVSKTPSEIEAKYEVARLP